MNLKKAKLIQSEPIQCYYCPKRDCVRTVEFPKIGAVGAVYVAARVMPFGWYVSDSVLSALEFRRFVVCRECAARLLGGGVPKPLAVTEETDVASLMLAQLGQIQNLMKALVDMNTLVEKPEKPKQQGVGDDGTVWCGRCPDGVCYGLAVVAECDLRQGVPLPGGIPHYSPAKEGADIEK